MGEAIAAADALRPNTLEESQKRQWLAQLDGVLRRQVLDSHEPGAATGAGADVSDEQDAQLLAPEPYTGLYTYWLMAQTDLALGELTRYANDMLLYNSALAEFAAGHKAAHRPLRRGQFCY